MGGLKVTTTRRNAFRKTRHRMLTRLLILVCCIFGFADNSFPTPKIGAKSKSVRLKPAAPILVSRNKRFVYLNSSGRVALPGQFLSAKPFREGLASVQRKSEEGFGYINQRGQFVIRPQFSEAASFSEGLALVRHSASGKYGYINQKGVFVIGPRFDTAGDFHDGLALVRQPEDGDYGYINRQGALVIPYRFRVAEGFSDGLAHVQGTDSYWHGFANTRGELVIPPQFEAARPFSEQRAAVRLESRWGFIDTNGNLITDSRFDDVGRFSDGLAAVKVGEKWGYIDRSGALVIPAQFDGADEFSEGYAAVGLGDRFTYIDKSGRVTMPAWFFLAGPFKNKRALVTDKVLGNWGLIDPKGKFVARWEFDDSQLPSLTGNRIRRIPAVFRTEPPGARIFMIPKYDFESDPSVAANLARLEGCCEVPKGLTPQTINVPRMVYRVVFERGGRLTHPYPLEVRENDENLVVGHFR